MIVCVKCDEVQYHGAMPASCSDVEKVMCYSCAMDYTMENEYENMAYDMAMDR